MPTSGEVHINGAHVFINDVSVSSLKANPPADHVRKDMNKAQAKPPSRAARASSKPGARRAKAGKPSAPPAGGTGTSQKRAELAHYWATHPAEYDKWARENGKDRTDCGVFIGKVMRDSGSDPNYPTGGTGVQWDYVHNPKNGWTVGPVGADGPEPGDVLLHQPYLRPSGHVYGHTGLYAGSDGGGHDVTDEASLGGHGPESDSKYTDASLARTYQIWARPPGGQ